MHFEETNLAGAWLFDLERIEDDHGFFAGTFCARDSERRDLKPVVPAWLSPEHRGTGHKSRQTADALPHKAGDDGPMTGPKQHAE